MPEFISKLQYKTYEKGEFSDEKVRSLDETLDLIKNFPWSEQRGVDIQLTGPSVNIRDEYVNYLKVALYFNGKFCLYYLDNDHHLYEFHTPDLSKAYELVTNFFNNAIDLQTFEKQLFSINAVSHFENGSFEYSVNGWLMTLYLALLFFFACFTVIGTVSFFKIKDMPKQFILLFLFLDILLLSTLYFIIKMYLKTKDMSLYLTSGNNNFQFGRNDVLEDYSKNDIESINIHGQIGRSSRIFNLMEIVFKDGTILMVPGTLIDPYTFIAKFPNISPNYKGGYYLTSKILWAFTQ